MILILYTLAICLPFAAFPPFLHWCLGSPTIAGSIYRAEYKEGRIFSFYGRWLKKVYEANMAKLEKVNNERIQRLYAEKVSSENFKNLDPGSQAIEASNYMAMLNAQTVGAITFPFFSIRGIMKPLGLCFLCFSTWLCLFAATVCTIVTTYYIDGYSLFLLPLAFINAFSATVWVTLIIRSHYPK